MKDRERKKEGGRRSRVSSLLDNEEDDELGQPRIRKKSSNKKFNSFDDLDELGVEKSFTVRIKNKNYFIILDNSIPNNNRRR